MRRRWLAVAAAGLMLGATACAALTPAELFAKVSPSVWRVRTYDKEDLPVGFGTAVVIAPDTLITNCHVLSKAARFTVQHSQGVLPGTLEMWDPPRDLCQIKVPRLGAPAVSLGDTHTLAVGQPVFALGNPAGLDLTLSAGLISSLRRDDDQKLNLIQTSAPISPGSSGGGLFDEQGRLIGLTTLTLSGLSTQNLNFAVPVDWVRELPRRHRAARQAAQAEAAAAQEAANKAASDASP